MSWGHHHYQPLPISTGNVGVDRCGNVHYYAAPRVITARACWPSWPVCTQWPWWGCCSCGGRCTGGCGGWGWAGAGCGGLANVLTGGAPLAAWMLAQPGPPPRPLPVVKVA